MKNDYSVDLPISFEDDRHEALIGMWWTATLLRRASRRTFKELGMTEARFNLLRILKYTELPVTQNEIGKKMLVDKANVTSLVDGLEREELVRRKKDPSDRRRYHIELTSDGLVAIDRVDLVYTSKIGSIMKSFTGKEVGEINRLTRKVRAGLAALDPPAARQ
jgi:MarR family 2-MHQ and catechol resistance regulon transcriptional repressor